MVLDMILVMLSGGCLAFRQAHGRTGDGLDWCCSSGSADVCGILGNVNGAVLASHLLVFLFVTVGT